MPRINLVVEGQTEEGFVNQVLAPHLGAAGIFAKARCVTTRLDRRRPDLVHRGGLPNYGKARRDLERWLAEDPGAMFTTMFDLYALPKDFPAFTDSRRWNGPYQRVAALEAAFAADFADDRSFTNLRRSCSATLKSSTGNTWSTRSRLHDSSRSRRRIRARSSLMMARRPPRRSAS